MVIYQVEEGQIGLLFAVVLNKKDLGRIMEHNPLNSKVGHLRVNISFCEPPRSVSFDINKKIYFISLCSKEIRCLKEGRDVRVTSLVEDIPFTINIFLGIDGQDINRVIRQTYI